MKKVKQVLVYIEGQGGGAIGTSRRSHLNGEFRKSWKKFLEPLADHARKQGVIFFQCIPGRGGSEVAETFAKPLKAQEGALRILIIDSEGPVDDIDDPWAKVKSERPAWAKNDHCYLMVQCLEAWLLADKEGLRKHYKSKHRCFDEDKIPNWDNIEKINYNKVQDALVAATSGEGCNHSYKHAHGNFLISEVSRDKVEALRSAERVFTKLKDAISEYART